MTRVRDMLGPLKTLTTTIQSPQETLLGTPEALPTSEPATPQISYTVASGDLPTFTVQPVSKKWVALIHAAGKNTTAGSVAVNWRMKKNGSSVITGGWSIAANTFYTYISCFYDIAVGDVLEVALWAGASGCNWDYKAYQVQPTRMAPKLRDPILIPSNITALVAHPTLTLGNPSGTNSSFAIYHGDTLTASISGTINLPCQVAKIGGSGLGWGRICYGDQYTPNNATYRTSTTYRPYYYKNFIPTTIVFRVLYI